MGYSQVMEEITQENALPRVAQICRDLIRFDTTNYGEGKANPERPAADYVFELLQSLGFDPVLHESAPGRANVVVRIPGTDTSQPPLIVHGHLDVVPAIASDWQVDPFEGVVQDGYLWGRGAVDMKNMVAMMLTVLEEFAALGRKPRRELIFAFFADEEAGSRYGSHFMVDNFPELFAGATEAISEVGGFSVDVNGKNAYLIQTGEKALLWLKIRSVGRAGHGSQVNDDNAVTKLAEALLRISSDDWPLQLTQTTSTMLMELYRLTKSTIDSPDAEELHSSEQLTEEGIEHILTHLHSVRPFLQASLKNVVNPTGLVAGYKHNVIPGEAEAWLDVRTLPGEENAVLERVRTLAGPDIEVEISVQDIGFETSFDGELVDAMTSSIQKYDPQAIFLPYLLSGGTDNKALSKLGIRGFGFVPMQLPKELNFGELFHGVDERVPIDSLLFGKQVLFELLSKY